MQIREAEKKALPIVKEFISGLNGRFKEHCSDDMLLALIMQSVQVVMIDVCQRANTEEFNMDDIKGVGYKSSIVLFEHILEHGCGVVMNGHHVAQDLDKALTDGV